MLPKLPEGFSTYAPFLEGILEEIQGIMENGEGGMKYNTLSLFVLVRELALEDPDVSGYVGGVLVVLSFLSLGFLKENQVPSKDIVSRSLEEAWFPADSKNAGINRRLLEYLLLKIKELPEN